MSYERDRSVLPVVGDLLHPPFSSSVAHGSSTVRVRDRPSPLVSRRAECNARLAAKPRYEQDFGAPGIDVASRRVLSSSKRWRSRKGRDVSKGNDKLCEGSGPGRLLAYHWGWGQGEGCEGVRKRVQQMGAKKEKEPDREGIREKGRAEGLEDRFYDRCTQY